MGIIQAYSYEPFCPSHRKSWTEKLHLQFCGNCIFVIAYIGIYVYKNYY